MRAAWAVTPERPTARARRAKNLTERNMEVVVNSIQAELVDELGEPAALLGVGQLAFADELDAHIGDVGRSNGVGGGNIVDAHDAVEDDILGFAGKSNNAGA